MRTGDMVRFEHPHKFGAFYGLLVEYHPWEKIATVLFKGEIIRIRAERVTKAGKKDSLE